MAFFDFSSSIVNLLGHILSTDGAALRRSKSLERSKMDAKERL
jgi:hypothetical protein